MAIRVAQVVELMTKLAKKGMTPSQIGVVLRDQHGVTQVKAVNGSSVLRILKGLVRPLPSPAILVVREAKSVATAV